MFPLVTRVLEWAELGSAAGTDNDNALTTPANKAPSTTEPATDEAAGRFVLQTAGPDASGVSSHAVHYALLFVSQSAADQTYGVRIWGWRKLGTLYVPHLLGELSLTAGARVGIAGATIDETWYFPDAIIVDGHLVANRASDILDDVSIRRRSVRAEVQPQVLEGREGEPPHANLKVVTGTRLLRPRPQPALLGGRVEPLLRFKHVFQHADERSGLCWVLQVEVLVQECRRGLAASHRVSKVGTGPELGMPGGEIADAGLDDPLVVPVQRQHAVNHLDRRRVVRGRRRFGGCAGVVASDRVGQLVGVSLSHAGQRTAHAPAEEKAPASAEA